MVLALRHHLGETQPDAGISTDRPTKSHEYIFLLTKSPRYFYDADAVREAHTHPDAKYNTGNWAEDVRDAGRVIDRPFAISISRPKNYIGNINGRNRRTVWTITTKPYSGAHFAVFPPDLIEPCLKAGTSERGVCSECGKPWERVVERTKYNPAVVDEDIRNVDKSRGDKTRKLSGSEYNKSVKTIKEYWHPACSCDAEPIPAVVFDPFGGSGTTALVARQLGRDAVLLELNPEYCQLARQRLGLVALEQWQGKIEAVTANLEGLPLFQEVKP